MEATIRIRKEDWNTLQNEASALKEGDNLIVYAGFSQRRTRWNIIEIRKLPVQVERKTKDGFVYTYPGIKNLGFYPPRNSTKRFCGTFVIGDGLELSLEDAYWMGRDRMDFRLKIDKDAMGELTFKALGVDNSSGELDKVKIELV